MKTLSILILVTVFGVVFWFGSGCASPELQDGYQFGDATSITVNTVLKLEAARADYCDQTQDSILRQAALVFIRQQIPLFPANGICADASLSMTELLNKAIATKASDSPD